MKDISTGSIVQNLAGREQVLLMVLWECSVSNPGLEAAHPDVRFSWFYTVLPRRILYYFHCIIPTPCSFDIEGVVKQPTEE
jgi:hypothetical protein